MRFLTSIGASRTSNPATVAVPDVGGKKHVNTRMVVVLPAPFGPRKPTIWPFSTSNEMWSTAVLRAYLLERSFTLIIEFSFFGSKISCTGVAHVNRKFLRTVRLRNNILKTSKASCQYLT